MDHIERAYGGLRELCLFAGAGGGILGGRLCGWRTVCAVEIDAYAQAVLCARQNDGTIPPFPIWDDVRTFNGAPWRGHIDVVSGGFPCQDISVAGKGSGITGSRSGLWSEFARISGEVRPKYVFVENVPALTRRGLGRVLGDLAEMGYDAEWCVLGGSALNTVCDGKRLWIFAFTPDSPMLESVDICADIVPSSEKSRRRQFARAVGATISQADYSKIKRNPDAVARQMDRLKAIGNGQVPALAALAWNVLNLRRRNNLVVDSDNMVKR